MSISTTPVARYTSTEPILTTSGGEAQAQLARMKARLIARYKLEAVPGRPEELAQPGTDRRVSLGYGCKTIRVRGMVGRNWIDELTHDFQIIEGWSNALYSMLDGHFGYGRTEADQPKSLIWNHPNTGEPLTDVNTGLGDR